STMLLISFLPNTSFLTGKVSKVENSCSSHSTSFVNFNFLKCRHINRKNSFHSDCTTHLTDGKCFCSSGSFYLNNSSSEKLSSCFITFTNFIINSDGIACVELWKIFFNDKFVFNKFY